MYVLLLCLVLIINCRGQTVYVSVKYDSRGIFRFDTMKNEPKLYRKYQAYIIGSVPNTTVQLQFEGYFCSPLIVEVSKRMLVHITHNNPF